MSGELEGIDSAEQVASLLRLLRRYADSAHGDALVAALRDLHDSGAAGLAAFEEGSPERHVEAVLVAIHQKLALLVMDLRLEIGHARLDAAEVLRDVTPEDFGGEPW